MADTPKVYALCDINCKWETLTKEQILTAIANAIETGEIGDVNTGFVQTIKTINDIPLKFFVGTQAQYDALSAGDKLNLYAIITDDESITNIERSIRALEINQENLLNGLNNGTIVVRKAMFTENVENAKNAELASHAMSADTAYSARVADAALLLGRSVWTGNQRILEDTTTSVKADETLFNRWVVVEISYYGDATKTKHWVVRTPQFKICDSTQWFAFSADRVASASTYFNISASGNWLNVENLSGHSGFYIENVFVIG